VNPIKKTSRHPFWRECRKFATPSILIWSQWTPPWLSWIK